MKTNYASRLSKLEKLAGKSDCPSCRLYRRHTWLDPSKPRPKLADPSLLVPLVCESCGSPGSYDLSHYPEELRELVRLYCTSKIEDTFTEPRAWAALWWMVYRIAARRERRKALSELRKVEAPAQSPYERQQREYAERQRTQERAAARAKDPDVKLYNKLFAESQAHSGRRRERLARRYGEHPFPELEALIAAVEIPDYAALYRGEPYAHDVPFSPMHETTREAKSWLVCAELEKIVLGDVTRHTTGKIADCERRVRELIDAARERHEEREEKRRVREAERERQRL